MKLTAFKTHGTPLANVNFQFCEITPATAAEWLKTNTKNRKLRRASVDMYQTDIKNGSWLTTHQGIAFGESGRLLDGQHRLEAVVRALRPVVMLVSTGWPEGAKLKTMDCVDRGAARSLADQLGVQHGMADAGMIAKIGNAIIRHCVAGRTKASTAQLLEVVALYRDQITFILKHPCKTLGVKSAQVAGCLAMLHAIWPAKTAEIVKALEFGENLNREHPLLWLRNWLMQGNWSDGYELRIAVFHHCVEFINGKIARAMIVTSPLAYHRVLKLSKDRVTKICALFDSPVPIYLREGEGNDKPAVKIAPCSAEAMEQMKTLGATFSSRDVAARMDDDGNAGQWLTVWRNVGWIESSGLEFRKTDKWGKTK